MAPLRIVSVAYDYYPFDVRVRRMAEAAVDVGYEMDVIALRGADEAAHERYNGVNIYRLPLDRGFGQSLPATILQWIRFAVASGRLLARLSRERPYDLALIHNMPDFLVFAALPARLRGARVILDVQDTSPELIAAKARGRKRAALKWVAGLQERIATRYADAVITVGWPFERLLLARGVPPEKLHVVLNTADPKVYPAARRFAPADALRRVSAPHDDTAPFTLMYWGTVAERNGLAIAVRALAQARQEAPLLRLNILGRGEAIPDLKRLATELGVADYLSFSEPVAMERVVDFITQGDVGVIPYLCDGFADLVLPTKAYELAWLGRPIIASDTPAIRSMFRAESMVLCRAGDVDELARAFVSLYHDPERRRTLVTNAARDYEPYHWEAIARRYTETLARVAQRTNRDEAADRAAQHTQQTVLISLAGIFPSIRKAKR